MKIRNGFVSNSSSSSFICEITNRIETGYDMSLEDAGMYNCVCGHTFDEEYLIDPDAEAKKEYILSEHLDKINYYKNRLENVNDVFLLEEFNEKLNKEILILADLEKEMETLNEREIDIMYLDSIGEDSRYECPTCCCPICTLDEILDDTYIQYIEKKFSLNRSEIRREIRTKFKDLYELIDYLK